MARLCKGGEQLRKEVNALWPKRDKKSDGWAASSAHSKVNPASDHEPDINGIVHAIDIDEDLGGKDGSDPIAANRLAEQIVAKGKAGDKRLKYVIFEGSIWSVTYGWRRKPYTGHNAHAKHIHVSFTNAADTNGKPFGLTK